MVFFSVVLSAQAYRVNVTLFTIPQRIFNEDNSPHDGPNPAENEYCSAELQQGGEEANAERPTAVAWAVLSLRAEDDAKGGNQGPCRAIAFVAYDHYLETSFFIVHCKG